MTEIRRVQNPPRKGGIQDNDLFSGHEVLRARREMLLGFTAVEIEPLQIDGPVVYFVEAVGKIKVGFTRNLNDRLTDLQACSPVDLHVLGYAAGTEAEERRVHRRFAHLRAHGEWFHANPELRAFARRAYADGLNQ